MNLFKKNYYNQHIQQEKTMNNYPDLKNKSHQCEDKGCKEQAECKLNFSVYCLRHYYEQHYRVYRKCCIDGCVKEIYKQFLTPPVNPYTPALGPYLCKEHFNELKNKCIVTDCHESATIKRKTEIQNQKVTYYLCAAHADDQDTLEETEGDWQSF